MVTGAKVAMQMDEDEGRGKKSTNVSKEKMHRKEEKVQLTSHKQVSREDRLIYLEWQRWPMVQV